MTEGSALLGLDLLRHAGVRAWNGGRGENLLDGGAHFYDTYGCADGKYLSVAANEPQFYAQLLKLCDLEISASRSSGNGRTGRCSRHAWPMYSCCARVTSGARWPRGWMSASHRCLTGTRRRSIRTTESAPVPHARRCDTTGARPALLAHAGRSTNGERDGDRGRAPALGAEPAVDRRNARGPGGVARQPGEEKWQVPLQA